MKTMNELNELAKDVLKLHRQDTEISTGRRYKSVDDLVAAECPPEVAEEYQKMKTQTPETDAMLDVNGIRCNCSDKPVELCRKLETQRNKERNKIREIVEAAESVGWNGVENSKILTQFIKNLAAERDDARRERDERVAALIATRDKWRDKYEYMVAQRDKWREVAGELASELRKISDLKNKTEIRGGFEDIGVPEHLVKPDGFVPIHPRVKMGLEIAAKIADEALQRFEEAGK